MPCNRRLEHRFERILGWFDFEGLYRDSVQRAVDGAKFVEVGCWKGKSTSFMATEIFNSGKHIDFYCVDAWLQDIFNHPEQIGERGRAIFEQNMAGLAHHTVYELSTKAAAQFADCSLDFVFIDASHDYGSVCADIEAWYPKVKHGGVLAGHDVHHPEVHKAVAASGLPIEIVHRCWSHAKP